MQKRAVTVAVGLGVAALAAAAMAQEPRVRIAGGPGGFAGHPGGHAMAIHAPLEGFESKRVLGAPYAAESVTERVQTLADGTRITATSRGSVLRDSEGRTRREQTLGAIGPMFAEGKGPRHAFINDPVAGVHYVLELDEKIARKLPSPMGHDLPGPGHHVVRFEKRIVVADKDKPAVEQDVVFRTADPAEEKADDARSEPLGQQTIAGVTAEGTRSVVTIPAGSIGNDRPLEIVSERWYAPQLQVVVMSRHSDPRFGETTYRLTNLTRDEPDAAAFTVPSDFTVKEGPGAEFVKIIRERKPKD
ncbi:MAG: hypothetical protein ABW221_23820 [Vicinamibacteria bacterium]